MVKVAVLISGGGTNLEAILQAKEAGQIPSGEMALVLSSSPTAFGLTRAKNHNVPTAVVEKGDLSRDDFATKITEVLEAHHIDCIVLAGFMVVLPQSFTAHWADRIINVHPSLIPAFCGDGFYGLRVHQAALDYGVKVTGATVHLVNEITDGGKILLQKAVEIQDSDTPETLQKRVMEQAEWQILPQAVEMLCKSL
ncbi:MAG: phosphoribosylglycinamide formyltransferase [Eubacteriales bacterium]